MTNVTGFIHRTVVICLGLPLDVLGVYETRLRQNPFGQGQVRVVDELAVECREGASALLRRVQFFEYLAGPGDLLRRNTEYLVDGDYLIRVERVLPVEAQPPGLARFAFEQFPVANVEARS